MARHFDGRGESGRNWGLLLLLGLCVEFWMVVTSVVAQNL